MKELGGAPEKAQDHVLSVLSLSDKFSERTKKLLVTYTLGQMVYRVARSRYDGLRAELTYSVSVSSDDDLYPAIHSWLLESMPPARRRALTVRSKQGQPTQPGGVTAAAVKALGLYYDAARVQKVQVGAHQVSVAMERASLEGAFLLNEDTVRSAGLRDRLILTATNEAGRDAVLDLLEDLLRQMDKRTPRFLVCDRWGSWLSVGDVPARPLSTVILSQGDAERIIEDLERFLTSEADCVRLGVPWHRGYLLKGPPGCGKTSLARALASHLGLDVYYLALSAIDNDNRLAEAFRGVAPRSVLMLEDIDVVHGARDRDDTAKGVTLAGLLNVLDGFMTPNGLITVMTSNHANVLDPALVRPGRVDFTMELGPLDDDKLCRLLEAFCGPGKAPSLRGPLMPAEVVGVLKDHLGDPAAARAAVASLCGYTP